VKKKGGRGFGILPAIGEKDRSTTATSAKGKEKRGEECPPAQLNCCFRRGRKKKMETHAANRITFAGVEKRKYDRSASPLPVPGPDEKERLLFPKKGMLPGSARTSGVEKKETVLLGRGEKEDRMTFPRMEWKLTLIFRLEEVDK